MNSVFLADVLQQPDALRTAMAQYAQYGPLMEKIRCLHPRQVLFTGMGSSHYCSQPAVIRLIEDGIPARVEAASEILYYEWASIAPDTLLVLTSQSGESGEIVDILHKLPDSQPVLGITNNPDSTLGRRANICLPMCVEPELAVSTRTYLAALVLSDMAAAALLDQSWQQALQQSYDALDVLEAFLRDHNQMEEMIGAFFAHPDTLCYIGRGPALATAECGALFTRETAKYPALAFDSGEFRHGPFEMVDSNFCAILFAPSGRTLELQRHLRDAILHCGGKVLFVTDAAEDSTDNLLVWRHAPVPEPYAPLVQIAAAQLFADEMALYRGHAPGVFRQSSKITTAQ